MKYVFDIETNGYFLIRSGVLFCRTLRQNEVLSYSDYDDDLPNVSEGLDVMSNAKVLARS